MRLNNRSLAYISPSTESRVYVTIKSETYFPTLTFFWEFPHIIRVPCGYQTSDNRSVSLIWTLEHNFYVNIYLLLSVKTEHNHVLCQAQHQEDDAEEAPANEEPHEATEATGQVPDVIGVELILPREA